MNTLNSVSKQSGAKQKKFVERQESLSAKANLMLLKASELRR